MKPYHDGTDNNIITHNEELGRSNCASKTAGRSGGLTRATWDIKFASPEVKKGQGPQFNKCKGGMVDPHRLQYRWTQIRFLNKIIKVVGNHSSSGKSFGEGQKDRDNLKLENWFVLTPIRSYDLKRGNNICSNLS